MPASTSPAPIFPPVSGVQMVKPDGTLTIAGLNLFQQIWGGVFGGSGITPGLFLLGFSDNINFNVAGDKMIPLSLPVGSIGWRPSIGIVLGTAGSFSVAQAGIYQLAFRQGVTLVGQTALSAITSVGLNVPNATAGVTPATTAVWSYSTIYLNVGTPQGATSQGNFYLYGFPVY